MLVTQQEVWLRAYCATLQGSFLTPTGDRHTAIVWAKENASDAVRHFNKYFADKRKEDDGSPT